MSREIKFRGMTLGGDWVYGLLSHTEDKRVVSSGDVGWFISNKAGCPFAYQIILETRGQYTGLKDKNGVEIYENDVVKHSIYKSLATIVWSLSGWACRVKTKKGIRDYGIIEQSRQDEFDEIPKLDNFEIIGNIYENPELLDFKTTLGK